MRQLGSSTGRPKRHVPALFVTSSIVMFTIILSVPTSGQFTPAALAQEIISSPWRTHGQMVTGQASTPNTLQTPILQSDRLIGLSVNQQSHPVPHPSPHHLGTKEPPALH
jgi:hypothetical protein